MSFFNSFVCSQANTLCRSKNSAALFYIIFSIDFLWVYVVKNTGMNKGIIMLLAMGGELLSVIGGLLSLCMLIFGRGRRRSPVARLFYATFLTGMLCFVAALVLDKFFPVGCP